MCCGLCGLAGHKSGCKLTLRQLQAIGVLPGQTNGHSAPITRNTRLHVGSFDLLIIRRNSEYSCVWRAESDGRGLHSRDEGWEQEPVSAHMRVPQYSAIEADATSYSSCQKMPSLRSHFFTLMPAIMASPVKWNKRWYSGHTAIGG
jgi:hypothetical protein